jgi:hypothetical protein
MASVQQRASGNGRKLRFGRSVPEDILAGIITGLSKGAGFVSDTLFSPLAFLGNALLPAGPSKGALNAIANVGQNAKRLTGQLAGSLVEGADAISLGDILAGRAGTPQGTRYEYVNGVPRAKLEGRLGRVVERSEEERRRALERRRRKKAQEQGVPLSQV